MSMKLNLDITTFKEHRAGWGYAMSSLADLHSNSGITVIDFLEKTFSWHYGKLKLESYIPLIDDWIGITHNPPNMPIFFDYVHSPQTISSRKAFLDSLPSCRGMFALTEDTAKWWRARFAELNYDIKVNVLRHPTIIPKVKFEFSKWMSNKSKYILQVGYWLRNTYAIQKLPVTTISKAWIIPGDYAKTTHDYHLARLFDTYEIKVGRYIEFGWMDNKEYDDMLSKNIVFVYLYDVAAANTVIECIARNTPLLVNRLPGVEEYIGSNYPLFYDNLEHAAELATDNEALLRGHQYLMSLDKTFLTSNYFRKSFLSSEIITSYGST